VFAVAVSDNEAGEDALEWLMSELVEDGDEIVAIRVIELDEDGESSSIYKTQGAAYTDGFQNDIIPTNKTIFEHRHTSYYKTC
jgi:hypothetical protein